MRFFLLTASLLLAGCNVWSQTVVAPCVGMPATGALGECPPCQVDSDCKLLDQNACEQSVYCVHKDSNWKVSQTTCPDGEKYTPTLMGCKCLANICDWKFQ
jgi:hypothetical protein